MKCTKNVSEHLFPWGGECISERNRTLDGNAGQNVHTIAPSY